MENDISTPEGDELVAESAPNESESPTPEIIAELQSTDVNPVDVDTASEETMTVSGVEFEPLQANVAQRVPTSLNRFYDVSVTVTVELGRSTMPIGEMLQLGEGAVLELDRLVSEPADVIAQGVLVARGEIVVVNDRYAVRIQSIEANETAASTQSSRQVVHAKNDAARRTNVVAQNTE